MSFDLKHVQSFVAVAETLSFSVAAAQLNTVQSAISAHIKTLEVQLNRTLLDRGRGRGAALTAEGAAFLVQARRLLALAEEMARDPGAAQGAAPLRLGTTATFAQSVVPRALKAFAAGKHTTPVTVRTARSHHLMDLLENGEIDLAFVFDQGAHPLRHATVQIGLCWVAAEGVSFQGQSSLPLAFLEDARDLRRHAFAALDRQNSITASLGTHPDPIGLRAIVAAGLAVTVMPAPAIVAPFEDVGARLGLPELGTMTVSVYVARGGLDQPAAELGRGLVLAARG